jgi:hypothetical protein
MGWSVFPALA